MPPPKPKPAPLSESAGNAIRLPLVASILSWNDLDWEDIPLAGGATIKISFPAHKGGYYVPGNWTETKVIAKRLSVFPLTRAVFDQAHNVAIKTGGYVPAMFQSEDLFNFPRYNTESLAKTAYDWGYGWQLASGSHKVWVFSTFDGSGFSTTGKGFSNYGFYVPPEHSLASKTGPGPYIDKTKYNVVQPLGQKHNAGHWDYSQLLQFMTDYRDKNGTSLDIAAAILAKDPAVWDEPVAIDAKQLAL